MLLVFLVLAALYESWTIPLAVLLTVPLGILGAVTAAMLHGLPNDVYFTVGIITIIGLAAKDGILIIEFAKALREQGKSVRDATIEACRMRFRPILMTGLAFVMGRRADGDRARRQRQSQQALGTGVMGGMIAVVVLALLMVPVFFVAVQWAFNREARQELREAASGEASKTMRQRSAPHRAEHLVTPPPLKSQRTGSAAAAGRGSRARSRPRSACGTGRAAAAPRMTCSTNAFNSCGRVCGMMLKPSAAPPRYHSSSASAMSDARAEHHAMAARGGDADIELADGHVLGARHVHDDLLAALLGVGQRHVRHRAVERIFRQIEADDVGQHRDAKLGMNERLKLLEFLLGFVAAAPDHRQHAGHDLDGVRRAPALRGARFRDRRRISSTLRGSATP